MGRVLTFEYLISYKGIDTNKVVAKAFLLTLMENQILESQTVADILGYTRNYALYLKRQMFSGSTEVLIDGRQGQIKKQDYVFKPEVKAELILQCSANAIAGKSTSSEALAADIKERCGLDLSDRSIRFHKQRLGLKKLYKTLPMAHSRQTESQTTPFKILSSNY